MTALSKLAVMTAASRSDCYLSLSGGNLLLSRKNGNLLTIGGKAYVIPAAGVTLAATGAVAATFYYVYAAIIAGVMTLEYSATGHSPDPVTGVEIKTGDASRTLVGAAYCMTAGTWTDDMTHCFVISWFNRRSKNLKASLGALTGIGAASLYTEISPALRLNFIAWKDDLTTQLFSTVCSTGAAAVPLSAAGGLGTGAVPEGQGGTSIAGGASTGSVSGSCAFSGQESWQYATSYVANGNTAMNVQANSSNQAIVRG